MLVLTASMGLSVSAAPDGNAAADSGIKLAWENKCSDAMPLLDQAMRDTTLKDDGKRPVAYAGVMCSMRQGAQMDAMSFLAWLQQHYSKDPDVLFLAVNVFSELSDRNAKELQSAAPDSVQVVQLNAENFERHGDFASAIEEYKILLSREPKKPGIHYRVGGLLLESREKAGNLEEARKQFEAELKVNPDAPGAEYYLGELDRESEKLPEAIVHYQRATTLQPEFADAYLGWGRSLLDLNKRQEAIVPLQKAETLAPENPNVHFALGTALVRLGRKADADREFALQKQHAQNLNDRAKALQKNVDGVVPKR